RQMPSTGTWPPQARTASTLTPASAGVHGPGEITRPAGPSEATCSAVTSSLRTTSTEQPQATSMCARLWVKESELSISTVLGPAGPGRLGGGGAGGRPAGWRAVAGPGRDGGGRVSAAAIWRATGPAGQAAGLPASDRTGRAPWTALVMNTSLAASRRALLI